MYEERKEKFSFKSFFLTLLLVLLFVFLMLWLFPNKWDLKNMQSNGNQYQSEIDLSRLSVLYNEIFAHNVERMKDAAIGYFTNERMPQKVGESKKLTLKEMYDLHLVLKLLDKDGNPCDEEKSYVEMTKYDKEYRLKVNLKAGKDEDYIIVYLGCYSYCSDGICEKRVTQKTETSKGGKVAPAEPTKAVYSCKVINGKYYNKGGNVVSKEEYEKSCEQAKEEKHTCEIANGKYYDKDGKVVGKSAYEKSCNPQPEKYSCKVVNGKYYDKDGNVVGESEYKKSCGLLKTMYEYKLVISDSTSCTVWSNWSKTKVAASSTREVQTKVENEKVGTKTVKIQTGETKKTVVKEVQEQYISGYTTKLVYQGTKDVQVGTTQKTITEKVVAGTAKVKAGIGEGTKVPANTSTTIYEVISQDTVQSCSTCKKEVKYIWQIYKIETVYKTVTKTVDVPVYKTINVYKEEQVPVYDYRTVEKSEVVTIPTYNEYEVPEYKDITYYRYRDCKTVKGSTDIKWSYSKNDSELLGKGYKLTGNTKQV